MRLVAATTIVIIAVVAVLAYFFLNPRPPNPPDPDAELINSYETFEDSRHVFKVFAEVTNNGGDGSVKVFAERKLYAQPEILDCRAYMKNNETRVFEFTFSLDPYFPSPSNQTQPPPISCRVWAEPD